MELTDKLSPNFTFAELTVTSNAALQEQNRAAAQLYVPSLAALAARILEPIRAIRGAPLVVNSAFRCGALNQATVGASPTSQHPMGQAADIHDSAVDIDALFAAILDLFKTKQIPFGQLIAEQADRGYEVARWVHVSLGPDFWRPERCGEVLMMVCPAGGKPKYTMIEKVDVLAFPSAE